MAEIYEDKERESAEYKELACMTLAIACKHNVLTDDNKSPVNMYSGLDQAIIFVANGRVNSDEELQDYKRRVVNKTEELDDSYMQGKYYRYRGTFFYAHGGLPADRHFVDSYTNFRDGLVNRLANNMLRGIVTDDNNLSDNGCTPLEQIIMFYFGDYAKYYDRGTCDTCMHVKSDVYERLNKLRAGGVLRKQ